MFFSKWRSSEGKEYSGPRTVLPCKFLILYTNTNVLHCNLSDPTVTSSDIICFVQTEDTSHRHHL